MYVADARWSSDAFRLGAFVSLSDSHIPNGAAFSLLHRGEIRLATLMCRLPAAWKDQRSAIYA